MIVTNPRRALEGGEVGVESFPNMPVKAVVWTTIGEGLALDVQFDDGYTPTAADEAEVRAVCQSVNTTERTMRESVRTVYAQHRNFRDSIGPQIVTGADAILADPAATPREKDIARGLKALGNYGITCARSIIWLGKIALRDLDGTD